MTTVPTQPPAAPRRTGRNILLACGVIVVICVVLAVIAFLVAGPSIGKLVNAVVAPVTAANDFMTAVVAKDYTKAQTQLSADLKSQIATGDALKQFVMQLGGELSSFNSNGYNLSGTTAQVSGTGLVNGTTVYITLVLTQEGDTWKIAGIHGSTTPPTSTPTGS